MKDKNHCPRNVAVDDLNREILRVARQYVDTLANADEVVKYHPVFLNSLEISGMSQHIMKFKILRCGE
jgi:hypothetical protein